MNVNDDPMFPTDLINYRLMTLFFKGSLVS